MRKGFKSFGAMSKVNLRSCPLSVILLGYTVLCLLRRV